MSSTEFTGSIPRYYDESLGPVMFEPYAADLVQRVPMSGGMRVLELACGTGIVTRLLRAALPAWATLVATDLNEAMVSYARAAVPQEAIDWQAADAQALPFADASFDVVVCQFGIMFLPDIPRGFGEAHRVLAPGGTLLANAWHALADNPAHLALHDAVVAMFPEDPPRFFDTPYGYHERARMLADAAAGGFDDVQLDDVRLHGHGPSALDFATGFVRGSPLTHELVRRGADLDSVARDVGDVLARDGGSAPFTLDLAATVITAKRAA
jgi:SAM-dependent methyltransferase